MSLHLRILKINNELISIFAVVDSLFDREELGSKLIFRQTLSDWFSLNEKALQSVSACAPASLSNSIEVASTVINDHRCDCARRLRGNANAVVSTMHLNENDYREKFRDQLFYFLRLLDALDTECLNPFATFQEAPGKILDELEGLVSTLSIRLSVISNCMNRSET